MRFAVLATLTATVATAHAQTADRRYAAEPTDGVAMPTTPLAGELDARTVTENPGGLVFLHGLEASLVADFEDASVATSDGPGFGAFAGYAFGGRYFRRLGIGLGAEWLRPPRTDLVPDPGTPFRFTTTGAAMLPWDIGLGLAWHHFIGGGATSGINAFDLGIARRFGNYLALGAALRDIATRDIGGSPVQRRYELEASLRPLESDVLEVAIGGRVGETRGDVDGWVRASARAARGVYVHAQVETRQLYAYVDQPTGTIEQDGRDIRATIGVELSFGQVGVTALATGLRSDTGARNPLGGTVIARISELGPASVIAPDDHIERVDLSGEIATRQLSELVERFRAIGRDSSAKAVVVTFSGVEGGLATLEELRGELLALRRGGKKVFAYLGAATGRDYFVASAADKIYVDPAGELHLVGLAGTAFYFRGAFDLFGIVPQFDKVAEFKSAPEMYTETGPTEVAAKMHDEVVDSLWDRWLTEVGDSRKLDRARLQALVDNGPYTAGDLASIPELVDGVGARDKISELIAGELHRVYPVDGPTLARADRWQRPGVAVIYIDGDITDGKSQTLPLIGDPVSGAETIIAAIELARANPRIGAIVLRINSPGGSAVASEMISREVFATRKIKPIICSMGDYAASGGYFVAAGCDKIFAEPMTITGSIGIYHGKFDVSGLLEKVGVTTSTYTRGKRADLDSNFRPYTDEERAVMLEELRYMYGRFVGAVAEGRHMSKNDVDKVGRGHVYTGAQAIGLRLVDQLGGLGDAIAEAKHAAHLSAETQVETIGLPRPPPNVLGVLESLLGIEQVDASPLAIPALRELLRSVPASLLLAPEAAQERLPFELRFK